jgi:hypothetical protein
MYSECLSRLRSFVSWLFLRTLSRNVQSAARRVAIVARLEQGAFPHHDHPGASITSRWLLLVRGRVVPVLITGTVARTPIAIAPSTRPHHPGKRTEDRGSGGFRQRRPVVQPAADEHA